MQPYDFRRLMSDWNDSHEPGVILHFKGGSKTQGIVRNPGYDEAPETCCWVSTPEGDMVVDILSIIAVERFRG